jgi:hypothetical protein
MVEGKMRDWFDFRKFKIYHLLQANTSGLLRGSHLTTAQTFTIENGWKGRKDAEAAINAYLADLPSMFSCSWHQTITKYFKNSHNHIRSWSSRKWQNSHA